MKNGFQLSLFLLVIFFAFTSLNAQSKIDTLGARQSQIYSPSKSPTGAMLRSAIIPGWGQFYNKAYWKIPIIWGASAGFIYYWIWNNNLYKSNADLYSRTGENGYYELREFYRDQRDLNGVFLFITYLLNIVDAYVDAHLFDFSTYTNPNTGVQEISLRYRF